LISSDADIVPLSKLVNIRRRAVFAGAGGMFKQDDEYDYRRYKQLLAEANNETKRLRLIALLIEEKARDRLAAARASDRTAMTAAPVSKVFGSSALPPERTFATERLNLVPLRLVRNGR
jgi:hypothetical protein